MKNLFQSTIAGVRQAMHIAAAALHEPAHTICTDTRPQNLSYLKECSRILVEMEINFKKLMDVYNIHDVEIDYITELQSQISLMITEIEEGAKNEE